MLRDIYPTRNDGYVLLKVLDLTQCHTYGLTNLRDMKLDTVEISIFL